MEIIQNKKIIAIMILVVMLTSITLPVSAAKVNNVSGAAVNLSWIGNIFNIIVEFIANLFKGIGSASKGTQSTTTITNEEISDDAMEFLAGVIFFEAGNNEEGQRAVGYVIKNHMKGTYTTDALMKALTKRGAFSSVKKINSFTSGGKKYSLGNSCTYNGTTYYTKNATALSRTTAENVMNGTAKNPIGNRDGFQETNYYYKNTNQNTQTAIDIGGNTFFNW